MIRIFVFLSLFFIIPPNVEASRERALVNAVGCSLFDTKGKLLKKYLGWVCAFFPNGKMLLGDGFTLTFYDREMNPIWSRDVHTHHVINYSADDKTALVIASNIINNDTRVDRLEVYDIDGKLLKFFNFTKDNSPGTYQQNWDMNVLPKVKTGITLIESFHRIGKNSGKYPSLKEGNYIAYDAFGKIYIFDRALKKIVEEFKVHDWGMSNLRDVQVTKVGNFLAYNSGHNESGKKYSTLDEIDPTSGDVVWRYRANPPEKFYGAYEGNVQILENGHLLFSVVMDELRGKDRKEIPAEQREPWMLIQGPHRAIEITRNGKEIWHMVNDGSGLSGMPNAVRRLDLGSYLKNKGHF